jgi:pyruvate oxidase
MMASAYSKWTKRPGVCLVADGSDLLQQLNGLYDASFDRNPVLVLTYKAKGFDPVNPMRVLADVSIHGAELPAGEQAIGVLHTALSESMRARGVAHLAVDWSQLGAPTPLPPSWFEPVTTSEPLLPEESLLQQAVEKLMAAKRPGNQEGRGAWGSRAEVEALARLLVAPVMPTMPGRGILPEEHPHMIGVIGSSGHRSAIEALEECDVLLILGSSTRGAVFGLVGNFTVIQVDSDALQLGRRPFETLGLYGSVKETVQALLERLKPQTGRILHVPEREAYLHKYRTRFEQWQEQSDSMRFSRAQPIRPPAICHTLTHVLDELDKRAIATVDVGVTTLWVYRHFLGGKHDTMWTASFATMGFSLPAAIALASLEPGRPVLAMAGDGGIGITMAELATAVRLNLPLVAVIFNNGKLAAVKFEQEVMGWPEYESRLYNCDFAEYAKACGAHGLRVTAPEDLAGALREALTCGRPCLVEVVCDPHDTPAPPKVHPLQFAGFMVAVSREMAMHVRAMRGEPAPSYNRRGYDHDPLSPFNALRTMLEDASPTLRRLFNGTPNNGNK